MSHNKGERTSSTTNAQTLPTFIIEATPLEVISLNDIIRYGLLYLEQHLEIAATRDVEAVKRIQARLNDRATEMMSAAYYARQQMEREGEVRA